MTMTVNDDDAGDIPLVSNGSDEAMHLVSAEAITIRIECSSFFVRYHFQQDDTSTVTSVTA